MRPRHLLRQAVRRGEIAGVHWTEPGPGAGWARVKNVVHGAMAVLQRHAEPQGVVNGGLHAAAADGIADAMELEGAVSRRPWMLRLAGEQGVDVRDPVVDRPGAQGI